MELRVLRYFVTIAREENITKAAELLHITQPTLSRQIAQMEEELGVKLFEREKKGLVLTSEGLLLRRRAEEILELVQKTEHDLVNQDQLLEGVVSIGSGDLGSVEVLAKLIDSFHKKYPAVSFDLYTGSADNIKDRMDRGLTDIGFLMEPINMDRYGYIRIHKKEEWVVVMHPDSPLAKLDFVSPKDLRGIPLILPNRLSAKNEVIQWFGKEFKNMDILFTANLPSNGLVMAYHKLACSIIIKGSISFWDSEKIIYRPLLPNLKATTVLIWRRNQAFSRATEKFIEHCQEKLNDIDNGLA